jgi:hypothetical protein
MENLPESENRPKVQPFLGRVRNKNYIEVLGKERFLKPSFEKGEEICLYEKTLLPENSTDNYMLVEIKIYQHQKTWYVFKGV